MVEVELLGELQQFAPLPLLNVRTVPEALRLIAAQIPEFRACIEASAGNGVGYQIIVDGYSVDEESIDLPAIEKITIVPVVSGSGEFGKIIGGIALIGLSFLVPGGILGISAATIGTVGLAMSLGGVASLLTPKQETVGNQNSYILGNDGITGTIQGQPVPIAYGDVWIINPHPLSRFVDNENIPVNFFPTESNLLIFSS